MKNPDGSFKDWASDPAYRRDVTGHLMTSYFVVYAVIFAMTFLVLPLAFFYNACGDGIDMDDQDGDDGDVPEVSGTRRLVRALKYTFAW